jgi:predicted metalloprotease
MGSMISGVLGEIDDRWSEIFQASGQSYTGPRIVLFRNATNGGRCGMAQSAMGPFYCPPDKQIFLDTGFFREVETRFAAVRAMPANSPRPTSSRMKPAITSRTCSASCRA